MSAAHEIGIVHYPGAQVACILGLTDLFGVASTIAVDQRANLMCGDRLPRDEGGAHFVLRTGNRSIAATRIFLASMTAPRAAAQSRGSLSSRRRDLFFPTQPWVRRNIFPALLLLRPTEIEPC